MISPKSLAAARRAYERELAKQPRLRTESDPLGLNRPSFLTERIQPIRRPTLRLKKL